MRVTRKAPGGVCSSPAVTTIEPEALDRASRKGLREAALDTNTEQRIQGRSFARLFCPHHCDRRVLHDQAPKAMERDNYPEEVKNHSLVTDIHELEKM